MVCYIKNWRRIAISYDKFPQNFLAATTPAGAFYDIKFVIQAPGLPHNGTAWIDSDKRQDPGSHVTAVRPERTDRR